MANALLRLGLPLAIIAFLYQAFLKDLVFVTLGIGRHIQPLSDFPFTCRRIEDERLRACEDMWLSDATRQLFLACSDPAARGKWMPNIARFNHTARSLDDAIIALDIDKPTTEEGRPSFRYRVLKTVKYPTVPHDDKSLHLVGLTGIDSPNAIALLLVNAKPSRDPSTGAILDNAAHGANSTIEHFLTGPAATQMKHIHTYSHSQIATPNNVATTAGMKGFYITNDHGSHRTGLWHQWSQSFGLGDITYCDTTILSEIKCTKLAGGINFPNGLLFHPEHNLLYVPSAVNGNIHVYRPTYALGTSTPTLKKVYEIKIPYPIDNLSLDPYTGDIYAAAIPKVRAMMASFDDPYGTFPPTTALRLQLVTGKSGELNYEVEKVLEDVGAFHNTTAMGQNLQLRAELPAATTVVRDGRTGRLFLSGESICFSSCSASFHFRLCLQIFLARFVTLYITTINTFQSFWLG